MKKPNSSWYLPVTIEAENEKMLKAEKKRTGASYAKIINISLKERYKRK